MALTPAQTEELESLFSSVVAASFERLRGIQLEVRAVNPFLVLITRTPEDLAEFIVWQRMERGFVTSLGMRFQKVSHVISPLMHASGTAGADSEGRDENARTHYIMQVKSGPDNINKDIANEIRRKLTSAENRIKSLGLAPGWQVRKMVGVAYGQPKHLSTWFRGLEETGFDVDKVGREFWSFVTGDPDAYKHVFEIASRVAVSYRDESGKSLADVIAETIGALSSEIEARYSDGRGGVDWPKLLEDNM